MRPSIVISVPIFTVAVVLSIAAVAHAQIRAITLNLVEEDSVIMLDGSLKLTGIPQEGDTQQVPLAAQKTGGDPGPDSRFAKNFGTVEAVVEFDGGTPQTIQLTGGFTQPVHSGNYCPQPFPQEDPARHCPTGEAPGAFGLKVAGDINSAVRDSYTTTRGQSTIGALGEINVLNWHLYTLVSRSDFDGTTILDTTTGILDVDQRFNANDVNGGAEQHFDIAVDKSDFHNVGRASLINASHFENDPNSGGSDGFDRPDIGTVNEATAFGGTFNVTGENATLSIPVWAPAVLATNLTLQDPDEDFIRIILKGLGPSTPGEITATGTFGDTLAPGDANNDGKIDGLDVNILSKHWRKGENNDSSHTPNVRELHVRAHPKYANFYEGDFDLDSRITQADLDVVIAGFGTTVGAGAGSQSVPEPGSLLLAALAALALGTVRRSKKH